MQKINVARFSIYVALVTVFVTHLLFADTATVNGITWTYTVSNGKVSLGGGTYSSTAVPQSTKGALTIPSTLGGYPVTSIGERAFYGCSGLTSVTIPNSVTSIGMRAFSGCRGLTDVTIGDGTTSIGHLAFGDCNSLTSVTIPDSVTSIGNAAFSGCSKLTSVTIPGSVTNIGSATFSGCSGLTGITIPNSVTSIGGFAFSGCSGLAEVSLPFVGSRRGNTGGSDSLFGYIFGTSSYTGGTETRQYDASSYYTYYIPSKLRKIVVTDETVLGYGAFYNCTNLASVTISDSVTSIGGSAFRDCSGLTNVTIPDGVTSIGSAAFYNCANLTSVTIPDSVTSIGSSAFSGTPFYDNQPNGLVVFGKVAHKMKGTCPPVVSIPDGVTSIGGFAFQSCSELTSMTIPNSVTSIGEYAFSMCSGLTSVAIPDSVMSIGENAFWCCSGLTNVTIPGSVTNIGRSAFSDCRKIGAFVVSGDNLFYKSRGGLLLSKDGKTLVSGVNGSVTIPDGIVSIEPSAFSGRNGLTSVTIPNSVTSIGSSAFRDCSGLSSVTIPNGVTSIGSSAFSGCNKVFDTTTIVGVKLVDGWVMGPLGALSGHVDLMGVRGIGEAALSGCIGLTSVTIGDGVTSIGDSAFYGCRNLTSVTIPDGVVSVGSLAFSGCSGLTNVTIGNGVTRIGDNAFYNCTNLTSVTIGDSVTHIGDWAFCHCSGLTSVTIPESVTHIGDWAFFGCSGLLSVTIGDSVASIGNRMFDGCRGLMSVTIPNSVTNIGEYAFFGCIKLTDVTIPDSITDIGANAFSGCSSLTNVTFYGEVPSGVSVSDILSYATLVRYRNKYAESYEQFVPVSKFGGYVLMAEDFNIDEKNIMQDDDSPWVGDYDVSHDGEGAMRSGRIENAESTWIETTVNGAGQLSFWWKASSEAYDGDVFDYAYLSVDGVPQGTLNDYRLQGVAIGGKTDWTNVVFDVTGDGLHTIRWTYCKDEVDESDVGEDCVWLDEIAFAPFVAVTFSVGDGAGVAPASVNAVALSKIVLPVADGFHRAKHTFVGWSDGVNTYEGGAEYVVTDSDVEFTAVWSANTLAAPVVTSADVADGGTIETAYATIEITAERGATIYYTLDGTEPTTNSLPYVAPFAADGMSVTIRAVAVKDDYFDSPIAEFSFTRNPFSMAECLNIEGRKVSTGGEDTAWFRVLDAAAHDGEAALRSGAIGDSGTSSVEMTVRGAGEISFWWKVSSEISRNRKYDYVSFLIDGEEQSWLGGEMEWTNEVFAVSGEGAHTLKWVYQKNDNGLTDGEDCAWLDEVTWTPVGVDSCFVEFDACGGEATLSSMVLERGSALGILPEAERSCYEFVGWYTAAEGGTKISADTTVAADVTYYAHWQINSYIVTFDVNGGSLGAASATTRSVEYGAAVGELPDVMYASYFFVGWYTAAEGGTKISADTTVAADVTYYAHWRYAGAPDDSTIVFNTEETYETEADGSLLLNLSELVVSTSTPKLTVKGLPTGLKFDAKTGTITGRATKPGVYTVTVSATNATVKRPTEDSTATFLLTVPNLEDGEVPVGGYYGSFIPGVYGQETINEAAGCTVTGLPTGMKWTAKDIKDNKTKLVTVPANSYYGTPSKPGYYTVYFTKTVKEGKANVKHTSTAIFEVGPLPVLTVKTLGEGTGKVTGAGAYAANKKVTLKATADTKDAAATAKKPATVKSVFNGWYDESGNLLSQAASYSYVMPEVDTVLTAKFIPATADAINSFEVACIPFDAETTSVSTNVPAGVYFQWTVDVDAESLPTVKVSGLPTGLKFTAKDIVDSKTKLVTVPANTIYGTPTTASKFDKKLNGIKPSVVKISVTTAGKTKFDCTIDMTVDAMQTWAFGSFNGGGAAGQGALTITKDSGKISGKYFDEKGLAWTLSATSFAEYDETQYAAILTAKSGKDTRTYELYVTEGALGGEAQLWGEDEDGNPVMVAYFYQTDWKSGVWKGVASKVGKATVVEYEAKDAADNQGSVSLKFAAAGAVTAKGVFIAGKDKNGKDVKYSASGSSVLIPTSAIEDGKFTAKVYVYFPPKAGKFAGYCEELLLEWDGTAFTISQ